MGRYLKVLCINIHRHPSSVPPVYAAVRAYVFMLRQATALQGLPQPKHCRPQAAGWIGILPIAIKHVQKLFPEYALIPCV